MILQAAALMTVALAQPLTPVPFTDVTFTDGFWGERLAAVRDATLKANLHQCEITGRLDNLAIAARQKQGLYKGYFFNDSDVYKAIEGAAYVLATMPDGPGKAALDRQLDDVIGTIAAAQQPDGYINSYFQTKDANPAIKDTDTKWSNTAVKHEMYCMGHLIEAAVAHFRATGRRSLLEVAIKAADHIDATFGPPPKRPDVCGHEEIELALIKLWRLGRDDKSAGIKEPDRYLRLAEHFVDARGVPAEGRKLYGEYCQDHMPLKDQTEVVGHAVRAMYLFSAATDLALISARTNGSSPLITEHRSLVTPLQSLWSDLTARKMYLTGGIGNSAHNEGFTRPYDLPNDSAYAETCATIGLAMWAHRLNLLTSDARYFDVLERALYNGILSGVSLDGSKFFYENPLGSTGDHRRQDWYACACCPPNILRFLASVGGMMYTTHGEGGPASDVFVNLFGASDAIVSLGDHRVRIIQSTDYPWQGKVRLRVESATADLAFALNVRIPDWCDQPPEFRVSARRATAQIQTQAPKPGTYYSVALGVWTPGDTVDIEFPMPVRRVHSHPAVTANRGRVALQRGPVVYCLEDADNHDKNEVGHARRIAIPPDAEFKPEFRPDLLGGVTVITGEGILAPLPEWEESTLYRGNAAPEPVMFTAIPYFAWDNRYAGGMQVWVPESVAMMPLGPLPGVKPSASHCWSSDTVLALTDRQEPASSADHQVPRHTFWPRKGTTEWVQLDFTDKAGAPAPRVISGLEIYWFDDGPPAASGNCRVPKSWSILYKPLPGVPGSGPPRDWLPMASTSRLTVDKDRYNRATFDPVEAVAVRIQVELQPEFSAGVLEIKPIH